MAATRADISRWFDIGVADGYKRMVVWCDTFDYDDYPHYTNLTAGDLTEYTNRENGKNMKQLMEVYDLTSDKTAQLNERRAFHY